VSADMVEYSRNIFVEHSFGTNCRCTNTSSSGIQSTDNRYVFSKTRNWTLWKPEAG